MGRLFRILLYSLCTVSLCRCAHPLPSPETVATVREPPRISTDAGWLTYRESRRIIERLAPGSGGDFLARHLQVEEAVAEAPLVAGNEVRLFADGPSTYRAMVAAIESARRFVHLESYIFEDDNIGNLVAERLIAKRREGVAVAVMVDDIGTRSATASLFERMRQAGIQVTFFNPVNPFKSRGSWSLNERSHRKILVVDGEVAFIGGINVSDVYASRPMSGSSRPREAGDKKGAPWRDTHISIRGPAVPDVERVFLEGWRSQGGPALGDMDFLPQQPQRGPHVVRIVINKPGANDNHAIYLTLLSAIHSAQRSIHITMAYFVPDPAFVAALRDAAQRGVDVVLLLPGFSDFPMVLHAGRSHYEALLAAGVKIYERRDALLHAKTAVVDGVWSTAGSSNLDWRSFTLNHEINAVILGADFGTQMEALFEQDRRASVLVDPEQWKQRPLSARFKEFLSRLLERWL
ncbi:MAG: cardiolipin synthase [Pigmentiphaga sp.]|uniref:cardiolipin synthase n=1 Tax=Pigmentiphaga sp. TaxID=1977564 RepID=UPI0029BF8E69|nr:cardiolipin synthase [Pigmentiphaga sp.]MDX3904063.1 cardiolipin synthase [Pigmentiphaga sp.]